jgi:hypothetical protein
MGQPEVQNNQLQPVISSMVAGIPWENDFIAEEALPPVNTNGQHFMYQTYDNSGLVDQGSTKRGLNAASKVLQRAGFSTVKAELEEYSAKLPCDYTLIEAARVQDSIRPVPADGLSSVDRLRLGNARIIAFNNLIQKEKAAASVVFTTTNYDSGLKVTNNSVDFGATGIIKTFQTAIRNVQRAYGVKPDTLVCGEQKWIDLSNNPDILARVTGGANNSNPALITPSLIAQLLGLKRILVGGAYTQTLSLPTANSAPTPGAVTDLWTTTSAALIYSGSGQMVSDLSNPVFGKMFYMNTPETGVRYAVRTWMNDEGNIEWIKGAEFFLAAKVMAAGYIWSAAP